MFWYFNVLIFIDQNKGERGTQGKADYNYPAAIYRLKTNAKCNNHKKTNKTTTTNNNKEANNYKETDKTSNNHKEANKTPNNNKEADMWNSAATCTGSSILLTGSICLPWLSHLRASL